MKDIEKVRRLERHQEKFKMRLAMQRKHPVLGHTRSARALERAKLDRSVNKDKRHFAGCYSHVEDEEAMTSVKVYKTIRHAIALIMAALRSTCGHSVLPLCYILSSLHFA